MPSDEVNDALWAMKMGKVPSEAGLEALSGAGASLKGQDVGALNAIIRVASCAGISVAQQWKLVDAMEKKGLGSEEFTKMIEGYVLNEDEEGEEAKKPTAIHMGQFFDLACTFLDFNTPGQEDDIVDPDARDEGKGDVAVDAGDDDGEDEVPNACALLKALLDSILWSVLTGISTAYALFANDDAQSMLWGTGAIFTIALLVQEAHYMYHTPTKSTTTCPNEQLKIGTKFSTAVRVPVPGYSCTAVLNLVAANSCIYQI